MGTGLTFASVIVAGAIICIGRQVELFIGQKTDFAHPFVINLVCGFEGPCWNLLFVCVLQQFTVFDAIGEGVSLFVYVPLIKALQMAALCGFFPVLLSVGKMHGGG